MKKSTYLFLASFLLAILSLSASGIQRVRLDFTAPDGYTRHLLLGFTSNNAATDDYDYGYDALNIDNFPNDLNWMIEDDRFVIQGVGEFATSKSYRLGMFLRDSGDIKISLNSLENFDEEIPVYVFDSENYTFTLLNDFDFETNISNGDFLHRFYITFSSSIDDVINSNSDLLSVNEFIEEQLTIQYITSTDQLFVSSEAVIKKVELYAIDGKKVLAKDVNDTIARINMQMPSGTYVVYTSTFNNLKTSKLISI